MYSGKKFKEEKSFRGDQIFIYDWDLNPIKQITLDREVFQISVSRDDKTLYSYDELTGYIVSTALN